MAKREIVVVAFPQAMAKACVIEDGISVHEAMCWAPDMVPCLQSLRDNFMGIKKIVLMGPISFIKNFEAPIKQHVGLPIELKGM